MLGVIRLQLICAAGKVFEVGFCRMSMAPCSSLILLTFEKEIRLCFVASWLGVSGVVFFLVGFVNRLFLFGFAEHLMVMVICFGNVPFLLLLRFVKILNFMISREWIRVIGTSAYSGMVGFLFFLKLVVSHLGLLKLTMLPSICLRVL